MKRRRLFEPCGADETPDEQRASSSSPSVRDAPWETLPHGGNVYINVPVGGTAAWVVHRVMQIREPLPSEGQDWFLVFHEGWAAAVDGSDTLAPLPLNDVFKGKKLWRAADGELFVENTRTKIVASLWDQWARYERADVEIMVGVLKLPCKHTCYITGWFRHGARVFWDAADIYKVLQLTTHSGNYWGWAYAN